MLHNMNLVIKEELEFVEHMISELERQATEIDGSFSVKKRRNGDCYYIRGKNRSGETRSARKLGGEEDLEVIKVKQAKYNQVLLKILKANKNLLEKMNGRFLNYDIESVDKMLGMVYRDYTGLVNKDPAFMSADEWMRAPYKGNDIPIADDGNKAMDGRKVRSKSEVIIYDILKFYGIPFRYDVDINLENEAGQKIYKNSDFVIWSMKVDGNEGKPIIWEHFGRMDDERYFENAMHKLRLYIRNGYRVWDDLILSFDSPKGTINTYTVHKIIKDLILPKVRLRTSEPVKTLP